MKKILLVFLVFIFSACVKETPVNESQETLLINVEAVTDGGPVYTPWIQVRPE
jgi:hypothetical protein